MFYLWSNYTSIIHKTHSNTAVPAVALQQLLWKVFRWSWRTDRLTYCLNFIFKRLQMLVILHNNVQVTVRSTGMRHESSCCLHEHVKATSRVLNVWLPVPEWAKKTSRGSNQREQSLKGRHFCSFLQRYRTFWYLLWCGLLHLPRWDWLSWCYSWVCLSVLQRPLVGGQR